MSGVHLIAGLMAEAPIRSDHSAHELSHSYIVYRLAPGPAIGPPRRRPRPAARAAPAAPNHRGGSKARSVPEFDVAAVGAIAAVIAGGGIVLARRRKS